MITDSSKETNAIQELVVLVKTWSMIFISKWMILLAMFIIGASYGFYKAYRQKPVYKAELTFSLDEKGSGGGAAGIASQLGLDVGGGAASAFSGDNNMELIKSRRIIEKSLLSPVTIDGKTDLLINRYLNGMRFYENLKENKPELIPALQFKMDQPRETYSRAQDSLVYSLYKLFGNGAVDVTKPEKKISIFHVKFSSGDEVFAKVFTECLVKNVTSFYIETKTKKYKNNVTILEERLDSVRRELNQDISSAAVLKDQNSNVIRAQGAVQTSKKQLNVQVLTAMYGELVKNLEFAKYSLLKEEPIIQVIDYPIFPLEKVVASKLKLAVFFGLVSMFLGLFGVLILHVKQQYL